MNIADQLLRLAIYEVYSGRCFYTGDPLDFTSMELDHIIPRSYKDNSNKLSKIITKLNLENDFNVDSLINLVPTNKFNNRRKSDIEFDETKLNYYFSLTKAKVPLIEKRIKELKKKRNFEKHLAMLKTQVDEERDEKVREKLITSIMSFILNDSAEFVKQEKLYYKDNEQFYRKYSGTIGLEALMPRYNNPQTNCVISFKTVNAHDCTLVLENKTVLSELFKGVYTDPKFGARGFIKYDQDIKNNESIDLEESYIAIGTSRLKLTSKDIYVFCDLIDSYANVYINSVKKIENLLKTRGYPLSRRLNNYKLLYISHPDWMKLIDFACENDVDNGNSKWNIFDMNRHYIKVFTKKHKRFEEGYHAFFHAEHSEDIVFYPNYSSNDVCITFEFIEDLDNKGSTDRINERFHWDLEVAKKWLVHELLPKVLGKRKTERIVGDNMYSERMVYINEMESLHSHELMEIVELLQIHFNSNPHNKYRIKKEHFQGIYNSILLCIKRSNHSDLHYLCNTLHISSCKTISEFSDSINELKNLIKDTSINGFGVDLLFRALLSALNSVEKDLSLNEIQYIRSNIDLFVTLRDREVLFDKYAIEFFNG